MSTHSLYSILASVANTATEMPYLIAYKAINGITVAKANRNAQHQWYVKEIALQRNQRRTMDEMTTYLDLYDQKQAIENYLSPAPQLEQWLAEKAHSKPVTNAVRGTKYAWQRLTRGWDDRALWNLDVHLCSQLGDQMLQLAERAHGWPATPQYPTYETWTETLRLHGTQLSAVKKLATEYNLNEQDIIWVNAQQSLKWTAENIQHLWD